MSLLVDRLGHERAALVIEAAGGERLAIPAQLDAGSAPRALQRRLGSELAIALVLHFGGELVYIPRARQQGRAKLSAVVRMTRDGKSANEIARKLKASDRTIYARRAEARELGLLP